MLMLGYNDTQNDAIIVYSETWEIGNVDVVADNYIIHLYKCVMR